MSDDGDNGAAPSPPPALTNADFRAMLAEAASRPRPADTEKRPQKPRPPKEKAKKAAAGQEEGDAGPAYR